jgi:hypothetical protein
LSFSFFEIWYFWFANTDKLRCISRGEKTAQALESNLTSLEKKIDDLLASFEEAERSRVEGADSTQGKPGQKTGGSSEKA